MKKGEIYEGVVERIDFPNKRTCTCGGRDGYREKCNSGTEDPLSNQQKKKEPHGGPPARSNRKIPDGKARSGLQYFPVLRRMHVPDDEL